MNSSSRAIVAAVLCVWGCAGGGDENAESPGAVLTSDASLFDAGSAFPLPGASNTGVGTVDAGSSTSVIPDAGTGTGSGFPRLDAGFPSGLDGGFPWSFDAGIRRDAGSVTPPASDAGSGSVGGDGGDRFENARQVCVDTINMYRATLNLPPLKRAAATIETCSDTGAKKDGDSGKAHGSAGSCPGMGAQNTCPGWPVGGFGGSATIEDALKKCLASMWAEGVPAEGISTCINNYFKGDTACFLAHGHYINMASADSKVVSCGFYDMGSNKFWMNQDFGR